MSTWALNKKKEAHLSSFSLAELKKRPPQRARTRKKKATKAVRVVEERKAA